MNALFEVEGLCISVGGMERPLLIEELSLRVEEGRIVGLVGETGAGKSLSMLASVGLLPAGVRAVDGYVSFSGSRVRVTNAKRLRANLGRGIALLFQNAKEALNPFMRVNAQIGRILKLRGVGRDMRSRRAYELLRSVGLPPEEFWSKYAHQCSGGEAQRIAMAIALATEPRLLIADEPTTALDVTVERQVIDLLQRLCRERSMGLMLITHNLALVSQTCDYVVVLHAGHVVERGPVQETFAHPLHPYTIGLMQAIPDVDRPRDLVPLSGTIPSTRNLGAGCRFSSRCPHVWDRCRGTVPPLYHHSKSDVRCFLYDQQ